MARPKLKNLNYFPFDVDFFEDDKIQLIEAEFGAKGVMIAIKLLCKIYKENGYYYQWGDDQCLLFSKKAGDGIVPGLVSEVVTGLVKRSFFDKGVFDSFKVLTSKGIQERFIKALERSNSVEIREEFLCKNVPIYENVTLTGINATLTGVNVTKTGVNVTSMPQIKGNKRKGKEKKENEKKGEGIDSRKLKFSATLKPFLKIYGRDFLNDFYRYWTEPNKSNTKFKQELERTWDLKRRLDMWARNDKNFKKTDNGKFNNTGPNPNSGYKPATVDREKLIQELTDDLANGNIPGQY